jgi:hypothetical protein
MNRNPMLNRMEIRDIYGVRTESTYVFLLSISPSSYHSPSYPVVSLGRVVLSSSDLHTEC